MTQQEFVKKLSRMEGKLLFGLAEESESMLIAKEEFKNGYFNGLTKGLEISAEIIQEITGCTKMRASELLEIFLTEKYGQ
jgi:hypothetical protein